MGNNKSGTTSDLLRIIPGEKIELLRGVYNQILTLDSRLSGVVSEPIKYIDENGIRNTVTGTFSQKDATQIQKAFSAMRSLVRQETLPGKTYADIRGKLIVAALHKNMNETGLSMSVKRRLRRAGRPAQTARNVLLYLLVTYAKFYDNGKPHFQEIADFIKDEDMTYETVSDTVRKIDMENMVMDYWVYCRLSCDLMPQKEGDQYIHLSKLPSWDSVVRPDAQLNYRIALSTFTKEIHWKPLSRRCK